MTIWLETLEGTVNGLAQTGGLTYEGKVNISFCHPLNTEDLRLRPSQSVCLNLLKGYRGWIKMAVTPAPATLLHVINLDYFLLGGYEKPTPTKFQHSLFTRYNCVPLFHYSPHPPRNTFSNVSFSNLIVSPPGSPDFL